MRTPAMWLAILGLIATGCSAPPAPAPKPASALGEEARIRERFQELQAALQANDVDKIWTMLDAKSQASADQIAKSVQKSYVDASAEEKTKLEKTVGLPGTELATLTGKGYLKTKRFRGKFKEVPEGKIDKVTLQDDKATVHFDEPDGDKEKAVFVQQDGQWKAWLVMPTITVAKETEK